ncbi:coiled-coil-helix-coiled-coil-helix domain containing 6b isoform X2 [Archocentrus centrarchus]|uniref:coiled-coil-helix-coiled-coil-helix domain containing 6b isoform X2 n=1 Tax=Archocentrus centrarchus TaxID=63155 RepID=UPI0011E9F344|nr:MICOS complex subunit mic25a-like isoform X2 [Archocentrus centrarchus]
MGGNGSTARKVSFGLDEDEKVTVIEGVKLSEDVLRRMRESRGSDSSKPPQSLPDSQKPPPSAKPSGPSTKEMQEEMRKNFERQQAMVKEQLARLAQRETETAAVTGLDELTSALITEKGRSFEEQEKAKILARKLEMKEKELASISSFYKEQLEILEKKTLDNYKEVAEQYNLAASKAEARIRSRHTAFLCAELQAKVLQCYRENPQQTLHCSSLAKQYMTCVHQAKQSALTNHG